MAAPPPPARRYKTTLSCAECRRLKLRCDRVFPCSSCQRRGCASICPDGYMPPSKLSRKDGPSQLEVLRARVQELEHQLRTLQEKSTGSTQSQSNDNHGDIPPSHDDPSQDDAENLTESLGTLSITGYGKSRFFGITGGTSQLLWKIQEDAVGNDIPGHSSELDDYDFPPEILFLISAFPSPMPSRVSPEIWSWINASLPSKMEAWSFVETFYENGAYIFMPLPRTMFIEQVFSFFYGSTQGRIVDIPRGHRLALLLMVFATAELLDLTKPAKPTGGKRFYFLARAALSLERLYEYPTLAVIQVMLLMMMYLNMSDHKDNAELVWVLSGINLKLAMMLGLHRDPEKFSLDDPQSSDAHILDPSEVELRRVIFHEVVHFEVWQCLAFGRPSMLHFEQYDCRPPGQGPQRDNALERSHVKGQAWSYTFVRECLVQVLNFTISVKPPKYADILKLDAKIREYTTHMHVEEGTELSTPSSHAVAVLHFAAYSMKEVALLYLHRSCFTTAMTAFPDPLSSPLKHSVLSSYRSASTIVQKTTMLYQEEPRLSVRIHLFWGALFVSCVLGAIVVRCPSCSLVTGALAQLDAACDLFQKAQEGVRPAAVLHKVVHLHRKAHAAFQLYSSGQEGYTQMPRGIDISAELSTLGGSSRSRTLSSKASPSSPTDTTATRRSSSSPTAHPHALSAEHNPNVIAPGDSECPLSDWLALAAGVQSTSLSLESLGQDVFDVSASMGSDAKDPAFSVDFMSGETHESFLQPRVPGLEDDFGNHSVEPTWLSFMERMGFN